MGSVVADAEPGWRHGRIGPYPYNPWVWPGVKTWGGLHLANGVEVRPSTVATGTTVDLVIADLLPAALHRASM